MSKKKFEPYIPVPQREALLRAFTTLCEQYQQIGEQLKTISELITPYLNGEQELIPPKTFEAPKLMEPGNN